MLDHLKKYHNITKEVIYNDLHGFIKNQRIHENSYTAFYTGFTFVNRAESATSESDKIALSKKAIEHYTNSLELEPGRPETYANRGIAKGYLGCYEEAIADYDMAIQIGQNNASPYYNRGVARDQLNRRNDAIEDFTKSIQLRPGFAEAYSGRGTTRAHLGCLDEARVDLKTALDLARQAGDDSLASKVEGHLRELDDTEHP